MKNSFNMAVIADIHFGKKDDVKLYEELNNYFIQFIKNEKDLNLIVIAGDLFDRVIKMNEFTAKIIMDFVMKIIELCKEKNILFRIIKGTKTHDFNQLQVFHNLENEYDFFKIYEKVDIETIEGLKFLYLPEEYPESIYSYYEKYLNNEYDCIIGHGMIDFVSYTGDDDSERMVRNAPVWKAKDLMNICNGPIVFGHIHDFHEYKEKIYYCGSFSRFSFADKEDKGFLYFSINKKDSSDFEPCFYENEEAPKYYEIDFNNFKGDSASKMKLIEALKKEYDFIKVKADKQTDDIDLLKTLMSKDESLKVEVKNITTDEDKVDEKFLFILNREYDLNETVSRFIKIKYDKNISAKRIKEILGN